MNLFWTYVTKRVFMDIFYKTFTFIFHGFQMCTNSGKSVLHLLGNYAYQTPRQQVVGEDATGRLFRQQLELFWQNRGFLPKNVVIYRQHFFGKEKVCSIL